VVALIDRLFTFTFLIPSMLVLMNDTALDPKHAAALALSWARLDWLQLGAVAYRAVARNVGLDATWG